MAKHMSFYASFGVSHSYGLSLVNRRWQKMNHLSIIGFALFFYWRVLKSIVPFHHTDWLVWFPTKAYHNQLFPYKWVCFRHQTSPNKFSILSRCPRTPQISQTNNPEKPLRCRHRCLIWSNCTRDNASSGIVPSPVTFGVAMALDVTKSEEVNT